MRYNNAMTRSPANDTGAAPRWLVRIERAGNRLPHPATLFVVGALLVMLLSQLAVSLQWSVTKTVTGPAGAVGETVRATSLLDADGLWWAISHMVQNFMSFPPLGLVLVGMLGIGVAERSGLIGALLTRVMRAAPQGLLTPAVVLLGVMSSLALDAGYVVLPPLAAALYYALGRPPLAGIAAAFAGVSAGFSANFFITAVDPLLAGFTEAGARVLVGDYAVAVTANWWFMIASTLLLTLAGWWVTARWVEPSLVGRDDDTAPTTASEHDGLDPRQRRGLIVAGLAALLALITVLVLVYVPGAPLHGQGARFPRWVEATVPLLFVLFLVPGVAYGLAAGTLRNDKDVARVLGETMAALGPYIVLAFFAAQFIEYFKYSRLGEMLAISGGAFLAELALPSTLLIIAFVLVVGLANLFIGSASAKYAFFAPVFVPMFMQVGISPELTQAAYRVGDSVSNVIAPLNPYLIIILAFMQRYAPKAGIGTLVAMMLPYSLVFTATWCVLLILWLWLGLPLGPGGPLTYP